MVQQLLGKGADTRAFRLNLPTKSFYELDLPGSANKKIDILKNHFQLDFSCVNYLEIDLSKDSLYEIMSKSNFSRERHTIFIFEGVVMYLTYANALASYGYPFYFGIDNLENYAAAVWNG